MSGNLVSLNNLLSNYLCQIDIQVLQSLPDDIRTNIEEVLQARRGNKETADDETSDQVDEAERCQATDVCCVDDAEQPGCSHWTNNDTRVSETASFKHPMSLPSYSQVV